MERKYKMQTKKQLISPSNHQVALEISLSILVSLSEQVFDGKALLSFWFVKRIFLIRPDFETLAFVTECSASVYKMEQLISEECPNLIITFGLLRDSCWLIFRCHRFTVIFLQTSTLFELLFALFIVHLQTFSNTLLLCHST
uniref:Uncharacterized protein n=1 Tax=Solanum lycopersicum TaxID=4081 RepID=A0A3Q7G141_SOLLC